VSYDAMAGTHRGSTVVIRPAGSCGAIFTGKPAAGIEAMRRGVSANSWDQSQIFTRHGRRATRGDAIYGNLPTEARRMVAVAKSI